MRVTQLYKVVDNDDLDPAKYCMRPMTKTGLLKALATREIILISDWVRPGRQAIKLRSTDATPGQSKSIQAEA